MAKPLITVWSNIHHLLSFYFDHLSFPFNLYASSLLHQMSFMVTELQLDHFITTIMI